MILKLSDELRASLAQSKGPIEIRDHRTKKVYVIAERSFFERALRALEAVEDRAAIQAGIDDMKAGNVFTLEEVDRIIQSRLESL
jgi:predicted transcriptional regulator